MVLGHPSGLPTFQEAHFTNGWLPSIYQGTLDFKQALVVAEKFSKPAQP